MFDLIHKFLIRVLTAMSPEFLVDEELDFLQISLRLLINFVKAFYCTVKFFDSTKWLLLRYVCIGLT